MIRFEIYFCIENMDSLSSNLDNPNVVLSRKIMILNSIFLTIHFQLLLMGFFLPLVVDQSLINMSSFSFTLNLSKSVRMIKRWS